ncbi:variant 2 [Lathyrus oleraceus]|uniref:Variant 2 n=1 Tax=Pisum sativum TaxID=3888 RepID=A0A9D4WXV8_PEA|nr:variant 2 [Pisum sativum]
MFTQCSGSGAGKSLQEAGIFWSLLMMTSFLFQAADTVLKEVIFMDSARKLKGGSLDLFVVNSFGSAFQCRHCLYASSSPSYQNYGASLSVNCLTTLKMVQPAF